MRSIAAFLALFFLASARAAPTISSNLLVLYSNGNNNIVVKDLASGNTVKVFTIYVKDPAFVTIDYEKDALFFTDDKTVYQIYLVDENGNRKISGKGELFTNPQADHIETKFYTLPTFKNIKGLLFDHSDRMLYLMSPYYKDMGDYFAKIDSRDGRMLVSGRIQFTATSYILHNKVLYATSHNKICPHFSSISLDDLSREGKWTYQEMQQCWTPNALFNVDSVTNRIFFTENDHTIRVMDGDITRKNVNAIENRYVISDSEVTKNINDISVYGNIVVWSSQSWGKLYIGFLNRKASFMTKQHVRVLDVNQSGFANIVIFKNENVIEGRLLIPAE